MHIDEFEFYEFSSFRVKKLPYKKVICSLRKQIPKNMNVKRYSWVIPSKK